MELNDLVNLERLEEQLFVYKPNLKSSKQKEHVSKKLCSQLFESKAVVVIQHMDAECENLMKSLKQRLMLLQDFLVPEHQIQNEIRKERNVTELNFSSDSSDDETLSNLMLNKSLSRKHVKSKTRTTQSKRTGSSEAFKYEIQPLPLRRNQDNRRMSLKSYSSSSTSKPTICNRNFGGKEEHTVSTSGVVFHNDEMSLEDINSTPTLHIKIPSLHRGNVNYIVLDSLKFARQVFDYRAREVKQQTMTSETEISKSHQTQVKTSIFQLSQQGEDADLSQLIQDVMAEACNDKTLQATKALENINSNLIVNYDSHTNGSSLSLSQSSQELLSQNSQSNFQIITEKNDNVTKKPRKKLKRLNIERSNEPPKKRGRRPKKNKVPYEDLCHLQSQPPTKSNLAKYVEHFANDCDNFIPGASTPAASSTMSQPLVSSTTHNLEVIDQQQQQQEQHSITYYIDGDWVNGGPCQLVPTNGISVDMRQLNSEDVSAPFQDFVSILFLIYVFLMLIKN